MAGGYIDGAEEEKIVMSESVHKATSWLHLKARAYKCERPDDF